MKESSLETLLGHYAKKHGCEWIKFTSPGRAGMPDRIVLAPNGRMLFMELKTKRGKLSALQSHWIERFKELKQNVCVIYGWDEGKLEIDNLIQDL